MDEGEQKPRIRLPVELFVSIGNDNLILRPCGAFTLKGSVSGSIIFRRPLHRKAISGCKRHQNMRRERFSYNVA